MIQIDFMTSQPYQSAILTGEAGESIPFNLYYRSRVTGWFFDMSYNNFTVNGRRLCVGNNSLFQWQNIIPFGLAVQSTDGDDPFYLTDFTSGRISLYLLNQADCIAFNAVT